MPGERHHLPSVEDLPEVSAMAGDTWEALPIDFGGWDFALFPAVWPRENRRWVRSSGIDLLTLRNPLTELQPDV